MTGRFLNTVRKLKDESAQYTQRKFGYLSTCIEMDFLGSARFANLVRTGGEIARGVNSGRETAEEAVLRKACANQLVVALMEYLKPDTLCLDNMIWMGAGRWDEWMSYQNVTLRSTKNSLPWTKAELEHNFMKTLVQTFQVIRSEDNLARCGFIVEPAMMRSAVVEETLDVEDLGQASLLIMSSESTLVGSEEKHICCSVGVAEVRFS